MDRDEQTSSQPTRQTEQVGLSRSDEPPYLLPVQSSRVRSAFLGTLGILAVVIIVVGIVIGAMFAM